MASRKEARAALLEIFEDLSEMGSAVCWRGEIPFESWHAIECGGTERIGRSEPSERELRELGELRTALGEWPTLTSGSYPEDDLSNVEFVPNAVFAASYADWNWQRTAKANAERERLLALEVDDTDIEVLARLCGPNPERGVRVSLDDMPSVNKLEAHGLARETGWAYFMVEPTEEGRERLEAASAGPRP